MRDLPTLRVLSLMSGTSLDGVDGLVAELEYRQDSLEWRVLARHDRSYPAPLRERLQLALRPETSDVSLLTQLHFEVGACYAQVVAELLAQHAADVVAISGQTVYHIPRANQAAAWRTPSSLQLGEASLVAERSGLPVYSDFRYADMAAGGQGAPMVSFGDYHLYRRPGRRRAIHNLGGISNLTYLPAAAEPEAVFAFDTGPANCLIDEAAQRHFGLSHDAEGALAAKGTVDQELLARLLAHPYLELAPPKTTGREVFTLPELPDAGSEALEHHDLLATLTAFSAASIAQAYEAHVIPKGLDEVFLAGGGAKNPTLVRMIRERLGVPVETFEEQGWQSSDREALAFAVMAYFRHHGEANTLPSATGARHAAKAGKLSLPA